MRVLSAFVVATFMAAGVTSPALGQSLAELAAKEKERRKKEKSGKVVTEDELRQAGSGKAGTFSQPSGPDTAAGDASAPANAPTGTASPAAPATPERDAFEVRAENQKKWRENLAAAQKEMTDIDAQIAEVDGILADPRNNQFGDSRARMVDRQTSLKAKRAEAQQKIEAIETEGRRNGYR